jgi:phosphoglycolate phosphatase-like HAD superfamily hydrolase
MTTRPVTTLVLWDVDHTLIENGGVSKENYALTFELLTGRAPVEQPKTDGRTDVTIMASLLEANGFTRDDFSWDETERALIDAADRNRTRLAERGHAMPGAVQCLTLLAERANTVQSTLTGNIVENAHVKLGAFGLDRWLDFEVGGFGSDNQVRGMLVPIAQGKAARKFGFSPIRDVTVLVGDTYLDVQAALTGGARVVAVATGISSVEELRAAGADEVLPNLEDFDAFIAALERVEQLGPTPPRSYAALKE